MTAHTPSKSPTSVQQHKNPVPLHKWAEQRCKFDPSKAQGSSGIKEGMDGIAKRVNR